MDNRHLSVFCSELSPKGHMFQTLHREVGKLLHLNLILLVSYVNHCNCSQMELGRWEARLNKMINTFDRKKNSIFNRLTAIEEDKLRRQEEKDVEVDKLKKKFAAYFIKHSIAERNIRKKRQELEKGVRNRNNAWLQKQKEEREKILRKSGIKQRETQISGLAKISSEKAERIAKLHLKLEHSETTLESLEKENVVMEERAHTLQEEHKNLNKNL